MLMVSIAIISLTCSYLVYQNIQYLNNLKGLANNISSMNTVVSSSITSLSRKIDTLHLMTNKLQEPSNPVINKNKLKGQYNNYKLETLDNNENKELSDISEHPEIHSMIHDSKTVLEEPVNKLHENFKNICQNSETETDKDNEIINTMDEDNIEEDDGNIPENYDSEEETNETNETSETNEHNKHNEHNEHNETNETSETNEHNETNETSETNEHIKHIEEPKESLKISQMSDIDINEDSESELDSDTENTDTENTDMLTDEIKNEIKNLEPIEDNSYPHITRDELENMTVKELKSFAANNSIVQKGTKKELLTRVKEKLNME